MNIPAGPMIEMSIRVPVSLRCATHFIGSRTATHRFGNAYPTGAEGGKSTQSLSLGSFAMSTIKYFMQLFGLLSLIAILWNGTNL